MTQPAVADAIGITLRAYQAYEAGGGLRLDNAEKLAVFFDVTMGELLGNAVLPSPMPLESNQDRLERIEGKLDELLSRDLEDLFRRVLDALG